MHLHNAKAALAAALLFVSTPAVGQSASATKAAFVFGTYPAHVRSDHCPKPTYFPGGGYLQGWEYQPGHYCFDPMILMIKPYTPRSMFKTPR